MLVAHFATGWVLISRKRSPTLMCEDSGPRLFSAPTFGLSFVFRASFERTPSDDKGQFTAVARLCNVKAASSADAAELVGVD